jgi:hypothetical protein
MASKPKPPSGEQIKVLQKMVTNGRLFRMPGGFWTVTGVQNTFQKLDHGGTYLSPEWSTGTVTVRAMEKRGWIQRANVHPEDWRDEREVTEAGRAVLAQIG